VVLLPKKGSSKVTQMAKNVHWSLFDCQSHRTGELQKSARSKAFVVHANKLKKCKGTTPEWWSQICQEIVANDTENDSHTNRDIPIEVVYSKNSYDQEITKSVPFVYDSEQEVEKTERDRRLNRRKQKRFDQKI